MTERAHAICSASGSGKWLVCHPSARFEDSFEDKPSPESEEGTFAHTVFEDMLLFWTGKISRDAYLDRAEKWVESKYHNDKLEEDVEAAGKYFMARVAEAKKTHGDDVVTYAEVKLDFSRWVPEGFGRADALLIYNDTLEVFDLKFGKGILVEAAGNSQMRLYALGAFEMLRDLYPISKIVATVLQPRMDNFPSEELLAEELLLWADTVVAPAARKAFDGEGEFVPGDHCSSYFCKGRQVCPARAEQGLKLIKKPYVMTPPAQLPPEVIAEVLKVGDSVSKWLKDVKAYALEGAVNGTLSVPGYKLVEGKSNRVYTNTLAVASRLSSHGIDEALIYNRELLGITEMESLLGKKKFAEVLGDLIEKPKGKPTLALADDPRKPYQLESVFKPVKE